MAGVCLTVLYCASGKADRPWTISSEQQARSSKVLPGFNLVKWLGPDRSLFLNWSVWSELSAASPAVVLVGGYNHLTFWMAMLWCRWRKVPFVMMCETHRVSKPGGARAWLRERVVRWVFRNAAGALPTGIKAQRFVRHYGGAGLPTSAMPNVPDISRLSDLALSRRRPHPTDGPLKILFVGRLIEKKCVHHLIESVTLLPKQLQRRIEVNIAGDGPERGRLLRMVGAAGVEAKFNFLGFIQPQSLDGIYLSSHVFVMPSSETWGVAPIEAAAMGALVIVADTVGCSEDLSQRGAASIFKAGDSSDLSRQIAEILERTASTAPAALDDWSYQAQAMKLHDFLAGLTRAGAPSSEAQAP